MEEVCKEGRIECIFLCEFHPTRGPVIVCQYPDQYMSKEVFEAISVYLIPKQQLKKHSLSVNMRNYKITGYPNTISNSKYARNAYMYNFCIVCKPNCRTVQYEPIVQKISEHFENLEHESGFLTSEEGREQLPSLLQQIQEGLNKSGYCGVEIVVKDCQQGPRRISFSLRGERKSLENVEKPLSTSSKNRVEDVMSSPRRLTSKSSQEPVEFITVEPPYVSVLYLHTVPLRPDPIQVQDFSVPVLAGDKMKRPSQHLDMTAQEVIPYIDGSNHIAKIAVKSDVNINLVKACMQNLAYYGVVTILPPFLYSNTYTTLPGLHKLYVDKPLQDECIRCVSKSETELPTLGNIFKLYTSMVYSVSISDLCIRLNPRSKNIDEIKLVQYGTMNNFIRKIYIFPVIIDHKIPPPTSHESNTTMYSMCNGLHSVDDICCKYGYTPKSIMERLERDVNITFHRR